MRTVPLTKLLASMQPGTALMGLSFTPPSLRAAVTTRHIVNEYPTEVPEAATLDPDSLLTVVKRLQVLNIFLRSCLVQLPAQGWLTCLQVGGLLLGGSALFRTNGLTQFGARHLVSRVGGDPFSNIGENEECVQLPIAFWCAHPPASDAHILFVQSVVATSQNLCHMAQYSVKTSLRAGPGLEMIQPK